MDSSDLSVAIGGVTVHMAGDEHCPRLVVPPSYGAFMAAGATPDVVLRLRYGAMIPLEAARRAYDSGAGWSIYRDSRGWTVAMGEPPYTEHLQRAAVFTPDFRSGELYVADSSYHPPWPTEVTPTDLVDAGMQPRQGAIWPLEVPLGYVLLSGILAQGRGALLHGCGLEHGGRGLLFCGPMGIGKSMIAELYGGLGATVLSDDRLVIREDGGSMWISGTPWHTRVMAVSSTSVRLDRLYFLAASRSGHVRRLAHSEAAERLMVCCFGCLPPWYGPEGLCFTVGLLAQVAQEVTSYEVGLEAGPMDARLLERLP